MATSSRFGEIGLWELDLSTSQLSWTAHTYLIFGLSKETFGNNFEAFLARVHPDDRAEFLRKQNHAVGGHGPLDIEHRIIMPDGTIKFVREAGELLRSADGKIFHGIVQDLSEILANDAKREEATALLKLAGRKAKLGGWRYKVGASHVDWSDETAAIHGAATGTRPTVDEAIEYYPGRYNEEIRRLFERCLTQGTPFDEVMQLKSRQGELLWVRVIGEAELNGGNVVAVFGAFQDVSELVASQGQTLKATASLYNTLENVGCAFITTDLHQTIKFANQAASRLFGFDSTKAVGTRLDLVVPGLLPSNILQSVTHFPTNSEIPVFEVYYPTIKRTLNVKAFQSPEGLAIAIEDITTSKCKEEQLQLLDAAVSHLSDMILITEAAELDSPEGPRIVYVNTAFKRITGYTRDEVLGKTPRLLQGEETQREELERIRSALREGKAVHSQVINYAKDGRKYWTEMEISPVLDTSGKATHFVSVQRDITERKRGEQSILASEERFRLAARLPNQAIWDWDISTDRIFWSERLGTHFGVPSDEVINFDRWLAIVHPDDQESVATAIRSFCVSSDSVFQREYRLLKNEGETIVLHRLTLVRDPEGSAIRLVGHVTDITLRKRLEEGLRQSEKMEALGQLTGGVAHDFNNLLTVILGNAESLSLALPAESKLRPLVDMVMRAAERGSDLTSRLLSFSRRQTLDSKAVDVNSLLSSMQPLLSHSLRENIELRLSLSDGCIALVDAAQLETAVLNLAVNAKDAMPIGGTITIETTKVVVDEYGLQGRYQVVPGTYVCISVSDNGAGMPTEVAARAMEPFFTTKAVGKGTGLGLSMVYGFVQQSGGQVSLYSEERVGTTVKLLLPCTEMGAAPLSPSREVSISPGTENILVVEDDVLVLKHVSTTLSALGYKVFEAQNGPAALETLRTHSDISLLFTDIMMPGGINGRELADRAMKLRPSLKVLFTSGYTQDALSSQGGEQKMEISLLSKPYLRNDLATRVRKVLDG